MNGKFFGNKKMLALAAVVVFVIIFVALQYILPQSSQTKKSQLAVHNFVFADFVDQELTVIPNQGNYFTGDTLYFVLELKGLTIKENLVFYTIDIVLNPHSPEAVEERLIRSISENEAGVVTISGNIELAGTAQPEENTISLKIEDNFSDEIIIVEKAFMVSELPDSGPRHGGKSWIKQLDTAS